MALGHVLVVPFERAPPQVIRFIWTLSVISFSNRTHRRTSGNIKTVVALESLFYDLNKRRVLEMRGRYSIEPEQKLVYTDNNNITTKTNHYK